MSKSKLEYHWFLFEQNNTHGYSVHSKALSDYVAFRVDCNITRDNYYQNQEFCEYSESILFYPLDIYNLDCDCCGARWQLHGKTFESIDSVCEYMDWRLSRNSIIFHNIPENSITCLWNDSFNEDILTLYEIEELFLDTLRKHSFRKSKINSYYIYKDVVEKRRKQMHSNEIYYMYEKLNLENETREYILNHHKQLISIKILLKYKYYNAMISKQKEDNSEPIEFAHLVSYHDIKEYPEINYCELISKLQIAPIDLLKSVIKFI
jgi:hypothetical protein